MPTAQDLTRLREYAEVVQKEIQAQPIANNHQYVVQRLLTAVEETIKATSTPVKIGLVSEFSAGKTLLIGALVGCGSALPINPDPTTGNITALEFVQHPETEIKPTEVGPYTIEYLSRQEVDACLAYLLEEAEKRSRDAHLSATHLKELQELRALPVGQLGVWEGVETWSKAAWNETSNPRLRYLIRELVWLARCFAAVGTHLCGTTGARYEEVEEATARAGLLLPRAESNIQVLSFAELPPAPSHMITAPDKLTVELLQATFPLVRRCRVRIKLSRQIWNLNTLQAKNPFILLDFPGLGADSSGVRDHFLCLRELVDVHTILVLLDAQRPGAGGIQKVYDMMQRDRANLSDSILLAISRFDLLPLGAEQGQKLQRLATARAPASETLLANDELSWFDKSPDEENLDENTIYRELPVLQRVVAGAQAFTWRSDRIVLLSSMLGLGDLAERFPALDIGSEELRNEVHQVLPAARAIRDQWHTLSQQLQTAGTAGPLTGWLIAFSRDGGLTALRELLQTHVQQHGLDLLYQQAAQKVAHLDHMLDELRATLRNDGSTQPPPNDPSHRIRADIRQLLKIYNQWKSELETTPPDLFQIVVPENNTSIPLIKIVHEEVVVRVFAWPEWQRLFNQVRDGYLEPPQSISWLNNDPSLQFSADAPASGEDFYRSFKEMYHALDDFTRRRAEQALDNWLARRTEQVALFPARLGLNDASRQRVRERLSARGEAWFNHLVWATKLNQLKPNLVRQSGLRREADQLGEELDARCEHIFPLHRKQMFAWHREMQGIYSNELRHQVQLLRLRNEFINSASKELTEFISQVNQHIVRLLRELFNILSESLQDMAINNEFIAVLSSTAPSVNTVPASMPQLADRLQALASPLSP